MATPKLTRDERSMLEDINAIPGGRLPRWLFCHFRDESVAIVDSLVAKRMMGYIGREDDLVLTDAARKVLEAARR